MDNKCIAMGIDENTRLELDTGFGRNSAQEDNPTHVSAWPYLMNQIDNISQSNIREDHQVQSCSEPFTRDRNAMIKCKSAFLPGSVGPGAIEEENAQV